VVSGAMAYIRAKYPDLNSRQAIEFTRQCTDDISKYNPDWKSYIPGRINILKALNTLPMSIPGICPDSSIFSKSNAERFNPGDTISLDIYAKNYLGIAKNLRFVLSRVNDPNDNFTIIDSIVLLPDVPQSSIEIKPFKFIINYANYHRIFFRVDISGENNYHDFFLISFTPISRITTFSNDSIKFSVSDRGGFGFDYTPCNKQGIGFKYKTYGNQLYEGGIMACVNSGQAVSALFGDGPDSNDFLPFKTFTSPNPNIGILIDSMAYPNNKLNISIEQKYIIPDNKSTIGKVFVNIKNLSGLNLNDYSVGYYLDWDIGQYNSQDICRNFPEAIPAILPKNSAAAELAQFASGQFPVFATAVYSLDPSAVAQAAGMKSGTMYPNDIIAYFSNGTSMQVSDTDDIATVVGMKFSGLTTPNQTRSFMMCFGGADNISELITKIQDCLKSGPFGVEETELPKNFSAEISPQPANEQILIKLQIPSISDIKINFFNNLGQEIIIPIDLQNCSGFISLPVDLSLLNSGVYWIKFTNGSNIILKELLIIK
jgi:hypothetical protein